MADEMSTLSAVLQDAGSISERVPQLRNAQSDSIAEYQVLYNTGTHTSCTGQITSSELPGFQPPPSHHLPSSFSVLYPAGGAL